MPNTPILSARIDPEKVERLQRLAGLRGMSRTEILRVAVDRLLEESDES